MTFPISETFSHEILEAISRVEEITIQVGHHRQQHRPLVIWAVVVENQVYIRSWTGKKEGWYNILSAEPFITIKAELFELEAGAIPVQDATLNEAISQAYHDKYDATWPTYAIDMTKPAPVATTMRVVPLNP